MNRPFEQLIEWEKKYMCPKVKYPCMKYLYRCTLNKNEKCLYVKEKINSGKKS